MDAELQLDHPNRNADPLTDALGAHPVGTGIGAAAGGAIAGAAIGTLAGPIGTAIGAAVGAIAGGLAGKAVAESVNPTFEGDHSRPSSLSHASPLTAPVAVSHQAIATKAYYIWEGKGRSDGHALNDWLEAESLLRAAA